MERSFDTVILLDIYGELLANAQREALDMRYNADLSLSEIAEEMGGVTRQSVVYSIKKGEQRLAELEEKLGFAKRLNTLSAELERAEKLLNDISADHSDKRFDEISELLSAVKRGL
ncbi:MAG: DNA-binding protein [Oscillospiraceae bacterium]|nr:DNA-binding protein [Oscillospiraceae bacterium]